MPSSLFEYSRNGFFGPSMPFGVPMYQNHTIWKRLTHLTKRLARATFTSVFFVLNNHGAALKRQKGGPRARTDHHRADLRDGEGRPRSARGRHRGARPAPQGLRRQPKYAS